MDRFVTLKQFLLVIILVALGSSAASYEINQSIVHQAATQSHVNCLAIKNGRIQGNDRAEVLKTFLSIAEETRRSSGTPNDIKAANGYHKLNARVHQLPIPECN